MTPIQLGLVGCGLLLLLLVCSMPVAFVMALAGVIGFAMVVSTPASLSMMTVELFDTFSSYSLTVIPLFVFMGQIAFHAGISRRLFHAAYCWLGTLRGGLAMSTVGACAGFGAICGSGPATAATMAAVALPEMKRYHYDMELASGTVAAGGSLGMLIPPSVVFIVYGILTEQSIGKLFMAGVMPGILIAVMFCITIYILCRRRPHLGPAAEGITWAMRGKSLTGVIETLVLFVVIIGGMFVGLFTPTEAAAVGAAGMVMIIVAGAVVFGRFLAVTRIPYELASWLTGLPLPPWAIVSLIILFYLVAGCFVDALGLILLTVPIFYPVIEALHYNLIWFGVIIVVVTQMGVISPPVGVNVYVVSGIERDLPLQTVFKGAIPFLVCLVVAAAILVAFPQISLWLPSLTYR
ncbi:MAG: Sialic acid TRAP transporter permease protein SiaT [Verrucomicrobia bacterium ADurb.Bin345]|nr:MAG: Sialic acid TRAP transporter permease protein SiaT [Verrucomicrobia bacterium ADurb.Bin345]